MTGRREMNIVTIWVIPTDKDAADDKEIKTER